MPEEYFTIISQYHRHRNNPSIATLTEIQLKQLAGRCSPRLSLHVNKFLAKNFSQPEANTR